MNLVFITAEIFAKNCIYTIKQQKKDNTIVLWIRIKDSNEKLDIKNIFDLVDKEIKGKLKKLKTVQQNNKSRNIRNMVQSLLKVLNTSMHMKVL